jgi:outer membrane protein assembly factor BamA
MKYLYLLILLLAIIMPVTSYARELAIFYTVNDSLAIGITGLPYAAFSTDKGVTLGAQLILFERNTAQNIIPGQYFRMRIDAERGKQDSWSFALDGRIPFRRINQRIDFDLSFSDRVQTFHGNHTSDSVDFWNRQNSFKGNFSRLLSKNFSAGMALDISSHHISSDICTKDYFFITPFPLDPIIIISNQRSKQSFFGVGATIELNTRYPNNFPVRGLFYQNNFMIYFRELDAYAWCDLPGDFRFFTLRQEIQYFHQIGDHTIAFQTIAKNTFRNNSIHYLASLGSSYIMRGLPANRFVNHHSLASQIEYRSPIIFWRISAVCFLAGGVIYGDFNNYRTAADFHSTAGFGFRFALDRRERINLRADVGFSSEGMQLYLMFREAF